MNIEDIMPTPPAKPAAEQLNDLAIRVKKRAKPAKQLLELYKNWRFMTDDEKRKAAELADELNLLKEIPPPRD